MHRELEVICAGMSVADILAQGVAELPGGGRTTFAKRVSMHAGGDALNQAVVLSRLGHKIGLMSLVGNDGQGRFLLNECRKYGVDLSAVAVSDVYPTSTSMVIIDADGERSFISQRNGTVDEYGPEHVDLGHIHSGLKVLSVGSMFCSPRFDREVLPALLKKAKESGAITLTDMVPNSQGEKLENHRESFKYLDFVMPSLDEAVIYTGKEDCKQISDVFFKLGVKNVVIKLGGDGVYSRTQSGCITLPAYKVDVVDTTGAGDNFVAGFISGLLRGLPHKKCLQFAGAAAALSIGSLGASGGVHSLEQVEQFMLKM